MIRYTDLSKDSGQPWFVYHVNPIPLPGAKLCEYHGYGKSLSEAAFNCLKAYWEDYFGSLPPPG